MARKSPHGGVGTYITVFLVLLMSHGATEPNKSNVCYIQLSQLVEYWELPEGSFNTGNRAMMLAAALAAVLVPGAFALPAVKADTVADVIKNHANLTTFAASLESANLLSFLGEQPAFGIFGYVALAPSDAAFAALPAAAKAMFDVASLRCKDPNCNPQPTRGHSELYHISLGGLSNPELTRRR